MAAEPPSEIKALIDAHINAFNTQNVAAFPECLCRRRRHHRRHRALSLVEPERPGQLAR